MGCIYVVLADRMDVAGKPGLSTMPVDSSRIDQADIDPLRAAALLAALAFARHDHAVLPLTWPVKVNGRMVCSCRKAADCTAPAKHPLGRLVPRGLLDASTDEPTIRKWF